MKPVNVLLVEDEAGDALLASHVVVDCRAPVKLHFAKDGQEALAMLAEPGLELDLVILDLNIPKISGFAVLERRANRDVPVVVFSSSWRTADAQKALALGASEYIEKPLDIQAYSTAVCGMIEKWTERKQVGTV
jgi:CheY-like chemotaxis protein